MRNISACLAAIVSVLAIAGCEHRSPVEPTPESTEPSPVATPGPQSATAQAAVVEHAIRIGKGTLELIRAQQSADLAIYGAPPTDRGFSWIGDMAAGSQETTPFKTCLDLGACVPGTTLDLLASWAGEDLHARITLPDGTSFEATHPNDCSAGIFRVTGSVLLPPMNKRGETKVSAPFVTAPDDAWAQTCDATGTVQRFNVTGHGTATVWLSADQAGFWVPTRVVYDFKR